MNKFNFQTLNPNENNQRLKVALLLGAPLTDQNFERMGVAPLSQRFEVVVFNCTALVGRSNSRNISADPKWKECEIVGSYEAFNKLLTKHKPDYAIDYIGQGRHTLKIGKLLNRHKVVFVIQKLANIPIVSNNNIWNRAITFVRPSKGRRVALDSVGNSYQSEVEETPSRPQSTFSAVLQRFSNALIPIRLRIVVPYVALLAGDKSFDWYGKLAKHKIWAASNDFHTFKSAVKHHPEPANYGESGFLLFIDDCLTQALDWQTLGMQAPVNSVTYFADLIRYFDWIESELGLPIIIAGHPNTKNDTAYAGKFLGRTVIYGKTAELTILSQTVLIHASTAASFAILSKTPIITITSNELNSADYGRNVRALSDAVGSRLIFIDRPYSIHDISIYINIAKYREYEQHFLKNELSKEDSPWSAFTEFATERHLLE